METQLDETHKSLCTNSIDINIINSKNPLLYNKLKIMWGCLNLFPGKSFFISKKIKVYRFQDCLCLLSSSRRTFNESRLFLPCYVWVVCNTKITPKSTENDLLAALDCAPFPYIFNTLQMEYNECQFRNGKKQWSFVQQYKSHSYNIYYKHIGSDSFGNECYIMSRKSNYNLVDVRLVKRMKNTNALFAFITNWAIREITFQLKANKLYPLLELILYLKIDWYTIIQNVLNEKISFLKFSPIVKNYFYQLKNYKQNFAEITLQEAHDILSSFNFVKILMLEKTRLQ